RSLATSGSEGRYMSVLTAGRSVSDPMTRTSAAPRVGRTGPRGVLIPRVCGHIDSIVERVLPPGRRRRATGVGRPTSAAGDRRRAADVGGGLQTGRMCGRYASFRDAQDLADAFAVAPPDVAEDARLLPP